MERYSHNRLMFYVKEESIVVSDRLNTVAYLAYMYKNREGFNKLKKLLTTQKKQFKNMSELSVYVQKHKLIGVGGRIPEE